MAPRAYWKGSLKLSLVASAQGELRLGRSFRPPLEGEGKKIRSPCEIDSIFKQLDDIRSKRRT